MPPESRTAMTSDVATMLSILFLSLAPTARDSRIEIPFVPPIAIEFRIRISGVAPVSAAYAVSPIRLPIHRLSTRLYAMFRNMAASIGSDTASRHFFVSPEIKSISKFIMISSLSE